MIKKLLTAGLLFGSLVTVNAQENVALPVKTKVERISAPAAVSTQVGAANKSAIVNIQDTLWYFYNLNRHKYNTSIVYVQRPSAVPAASVNTAWGSSFLNPSNSTITITGAQLFAQRSSGTTSSVIPVAVTLYTASPSGVPGASVATATCAITSSFNVSSPATFSAPIIATGAFFIGYTPVPLLSTDTLDVFLVPAKTATAVPASNQNYGEGLSYVRNAGNWISTTNYYNGSGNDVASVVVPHVSFNFTTDAIKPAGTSTAVAGAYCANSLITFTNSTDGIVNNRQFNYNAMGAYWGPKTSTVVNTPTAIVKYQKGSGSKVATQELKTFSLQIVDCGLPLIVGVGENQQLNSNLSVYPNPMINGKTNISGLEGKNTVKVYNMLGQVVSTQTTETEMTTVDLTTEPNGTYIIRITDSSDKTRVVKVIKD